MAFIDAPYTYVQQIATQRQIFQVDLLQDKYIAQQGEAVLKFMIGFLTALNELYPAALEQAAELTEAQAAELLAKMPSVQDINLLDKILQNVKQASPAEHELLGLLRKHTKHMSELSNTLKVFATPLTADEEKEVDIFWAKKIETEIAKSEITWGLDDLFN